MNIKVISKFNERPKTRLAWWVLGLGIGLLLVELFLGLFASLIRALLIDAGSPAGSPAFGIGLGGIANALCLGTLVTGLLALRRGERSWVVWLGLLPALLFVLMLIADFLFAH